MVLKGTDNLRKGKKMCSQFKNSISKMDLLPYSHDLSPQQFLALSKIKKCPKRTEIYWYFQNPMQHDITVMYSGKRFSRLSCSSSIVS
jgi:hypothetical protein